MKSKGCRLRSWLTSSQEGSTFSPMGLEVSVRLPDTGGLRRRSIPTRYILRNRNEAGQTWPLSCLLAVEAFLACVEAMKLAAQSAEIFHFSDEHRAAYRPSWRSLSPRATAFMG